MSWNPASHLIPVVTTIHNNIDKNPTAWLEQGLKLGCQVKYLNMRIDQRTGHFILTGDTVPVVEFPVHDAQHMFPPGWSSEDQTHHGLASTVDEINQMLKLGLRKEQLKLMAKIIEKNVDENIRRYSFRIKMNKAISLKEIQENWK